MSYKPQTQIDIENSPRYAVQHWRNTQETEDALDEFLFWLEYDSEASEETEAEIKKLVNQYLQRDMEKIKAGEAELLNQWIKATKRTP